MILQKPGQVAKHARGYLVRKQNVWVTETMIQL